MVTCVVAGLVALSWADGNGVHSAEGVTVIREVSPEP